VAEAGAVGYEPPPGIRIDCVLGMVDAYTNSAAPCPGTAGMPAATPSA
jgi:hypothetical protein